MCRRCSSTYEDHKKFDFLLILKKKCLSVDVKRDFSRSLMFEVSKIVMFRVYVIYVRIRASIKVEVDSCVQGLLVFSNQCRFITTGLLQTFYDR